MKKTLISFGIALIGIFILWTLMYWQSSLHGVTALCAGKGACEKSLFYCHNYKSGYDFACSFYEAAEAYVFETMFAASQLPGILTHPNLYAYAFYGIAIVSFLFQRRKKTKKSNWFITSLLIYPAILIVGIIIQIFSNGNITFFGMEIPYIVLRFMFNNIIPPPTVTLLFAIVFWFVLAAFVVVTVKEFRRLLKKSS